MAESPRTLEWLHAGARALRGRFEDLAVAWRREDTTAVDVALPDFEQHLIRWTGAQEKALLPAVTRAGIPGRDPRRELRLEYVQLRELTRFLSLQRVERVRLSDLLGYLENLERRFNVHTMEGLTVYYPVAATNLTDEEWQVLEAARPE